MERETEMKKAIPWILLALIIFYIGTEPGPASDVAKSLGDLLAEIFRNVGTFFRELLT